MAADTQALDALRASVRGAVLAPGDLEYAAECSGFNTALSHTPDGVVVVSSAQDVIECVRFASARGLGVQIKGGGHGDIPVSSGLLLSTRRLEGVRVDAGTQVATIGAGVRWGEVIARAAEHGLAPISGSSPSVGVVGFLLGGGLGPLARSHGFGSDYLVGATIVTASGDLLEVSADEHADLLWALRGGKGGFGVVTEVRLRLAPLRTLYGGSLLFDTPHMETAFRAWVSWLDQAPSTVTTSVVLARFPPHDKLPPSLRGRRLLVVRFAFPGETSEGVRLAAPLRAFAPVYLDQLDEMPAAEVAHIHNDPTDPLPASLRAGMLTHVDQALAGVLFSHLGPTQETPFAISELRQLGEATRRDVPGGSAVGGRESSFTFSCISTDPALFETAVPERGDALMRALAPWRSAHDNVNFLSPVHSADDLRHAWPRATAMRLAEIRRRYDPDGLFATRHASLPFEAPASR
jgi:FAD/FMN-containing dehydrogenase